MSVWITFTILTGAAAGGGGGGGGGGATRNPNCIDLGKASVKISGISTITPMIMNWIRNDTTDVHPRAVFSLPPDSIRLSSNMEFSPNFLRPLRILRHRLFLLCSQNLHSRAKRPGFDQKARRANLPNAYLRRPKPMIPKMPSGNLLSLGNRHAHGALALLNPPVLVGHQDGCGNRDRRIGTD